MRHSLLLLFLPIQFYCSGQAGFNQLDYSHPRSAFTSLVVQGDTISLSGITVGASLSHLQGVMLSRLDTNGLPLDYYTYFDNEGDDYGFYLYNETGFIKLNNGTGYAILGTLFQRRNGFLMIIDEDGNHIYTKEYPDTTSSTDYYRKIIELSDGFLIAGDKQPVANLNDHQVFVMRTDKQGNKLWEKWFGLPNRIDGLTSLVKDNNKFVIGYSSFNFYDPQSQWAPATKILALDTLGNTVWEQSFFFDENGCGGLQQNGEGEWIYTSVEIIPFFGDLYGQAKLVVRDSNFNLLHQTYVGQATSSFNLLQNCKAAPEGGYISVGSYQESFDVNPEGDIMGWMCRWSDDGDSVWSRKDEGYMIAGLGTNSYLTAVEPLPSGSFIACGYSEESGGTWAWLIKVNRDGCIDTLLCIPTALKPEPQDGLAGVRVYPNPADDRVTFSLNLPTTASNISLRIIDLHGKTVHLESAWSASGELIWDTRNVLSGLYFYYLTAKEMYPQSGSVVIQH